MTGRHMATEMREQPAILAALAARRDGIEQAVPATKTVTAQALAFAILAETLGPVAWTADDVATLPGSLDVVLADPEPAERVAALVGDAPPRGHSKVTLTT